MPQWSGWRKLALVFVVCCAHLALLAGFSHSFASGGPAKSNSKNTENMSMTVRSIVSKPLADTLAKPQEQASKVKSAVADVPHTATNQKIALPETPYWPGLHSRDYFLDTNAVDKTAEPGEDFEALLARLLPLNIQMVVLEFWIDKDGRIVEVRCLEGACNDDVLASLPKLTDLAFTPAVKSGESVANRKVIQIDIKPGPGL